MKRLKKGYGFLREKYELLSVKKYTTLAGTLVFFLLMSIVPFTFWLTLIIGRLPVDTSELFSLPIFASVKNILLYVQEEAQNATTGASVLLVLTTLYSATNFFYQMRKSGEIIYDFYRKKQGLKLRINALVLMLAVIFLFTVFLSLLALGGFLFDKYLPRVLSTILEYLLLVALSFVLVLLLNIYICPYKQKIRAFLSGTMLTVCAWVVAVIGFSAYLQISNMDKLYGALSTVIVFLLWLYMLMVCFIAGVIVNGEKITKKNKRRKTSHT